MVMLQVFNLVKELQAGAAWAGVLSVINPSSLHVIPAGLRMLLDMLEGILPGAQTEDDEQVQHHHLSTNCQPLLSCTQCQHDSGVH